MLRKTTLRWLSALLALATIVAVAAPSIRQEWLNRSLLAACREGDYDRIAKWLKAGAEPNIKEEAGPTTLGWAYYRQRPDIADLLRRAGAKEYPSGNTLEDASFKEY